MQGLQPKELSEPIKIADISPMPPKTETPPVAERAYRSIEEQLEAARFDVIRGLKLAELFGRLPVSVTHAPLLHGQRYQLPTSGSWLGA